ncbi:uncharacterized protein LOC113285961 [Papaver somniferum]|uniref:uncharacterized protein LOC113285961 n=1 Tax=Papaver somniferum TaxID=3469 RepID=UPI000E6FE96C|nr:uncharacterized protein LOC113285961 [Papaver somniferum]
MNKCNRKTNISFRKETEGHENNRAIYRGHERKKNEIGDQLKDIKAVGQTKFLQVIIVTSIYVQNYEGELYLSSTDATKSYINLDIPEVEVYKNRHYQRTNVDIVKMPDISKDDFSAEKRITIQQLIDLLQDDSNEVFNVDIVITCNV